MNFVCCLLICFLCGNQDYTHTPCCHHHHHSLYNPNFILRFLLAFAVILTVCLHWASALCSFQEQNISKICFILKVFSCMKICCLQNSLISSFSFEVLSSKLCLGFDFDKKKKKRRSSIRFVLQPLSEVIWVLLLLM